MYLKNVHIGLHIFPFASGFNAACQGIVQLRFFTFFPQNQNQIQPSKSNYNFQEISMT